MRKCFRVVTIPFAQTHSKVSSDGSKHCALFRQGFEEHSWTSTSQLSPTYKEQNKSNIGFIKSEYSSH